MRTRSQLGVLALMLLLYIAAAAAYILLPGGMLDAQAALASTVPMPEVQMPAWQLVAANAGLIAAVYTPLALLGYWLARRNGLPGIVRLAAGPKALLVRPLGLGAAAGLVLVVVDRLLQTLTGNPGFPHPQFPASIAASLSAGIGEEILTRLFVLSLWGLILTWLFRRLFPRRETRRTALWIANGIAALAFAASHLPAVMMLSGVSTPAALPIIPLLEVFLLNGFVGILAGELFMRDGLVAASGVHFWADMVWHVVYGVLG